MSALRSSIRHYRLFSTISATKPNLQSSSTQTHNNAFTTTTSPSLPPDFPKDKTLKRLSKSRSFTEIETLIESQKTDPKITQEDFFSNLIRLYGVAHMPEHALRLFNQMEDLGTQRSVVSFNALLLTYITSKKYSQVQKLFDEIPNKYGFSPDGVSYSLLIRSFCELSLPDSVASTLKEMEEKNIEVTTMNYTTILDYWYRKKDETKAEEIWNEMIEKGCTPDVATYNARIIYNTYKVRTEEVLAVIDEMKRKDLKPDTTSYNYLLSCYYKDGKPELAEQVYRDLEKNGCSPNTATYRLVIGNLCKEEEFEKAYEVFQECIERDRVPSVRILKFLVAGLVKISNIEGAKEVVRSVTEKFPDDISVWKKVEEEHGLNEGDASPTQEASATSV